MGVGIFAKYGFKYGFGLAGIGMALGLLQYVLGQKHLKNVGNFLGASENTEEKEAMNSRAKPHQCELHLPEH